MGQPKLLLSEEERIKQEKRDQHNAYRRELTKAKSKEQKRIESEKQNIRRRAEPDDVRERRIRKGTICNRKRRQLLREKEIAYDAWKPIIERLQQPKIDVGVQVNLTNDNHAAANNVVITKQPNMNLNSKAVSVIKINHKLPNLQSINLSNLETMKQSNKVGVITINRENVRVGNLAPCKFSGLAKVKPPTINDSSNQNTYKSLFNSSEVNFSEIAKFSNNNTYLPKEKSWNQILNKMPTQQASVASHTMANSYRNNNSFLVQSQETLINSSNLPNSHDDTIAINCNNNHFKYHSSTSTFTTPYQRQPQTVITVPKLPSFASGASISQHTKPISNWCSKYWSMSDNNLFSANKSEDKQEVNYQSAVNDGTCKQYETNIEAEQVLPS